MIKQKRRVLARQMRDYLLFYVNGKQHKVRGEQAFMPLSSYLRYEQGATGTKVVCEEGDCGACTVAVGRRENNAWNYRAVNSCIQFVYQLDCAHVVTVEGLKYDGKLNPVQEAMVACHGAQCGYCTPGFVVAMCTMFDQQRCVEPQQVKDALTGNLCRCTGYAPIIEAALQVDADQMTPLEKLYPSQQMAEDCDTHAQSAVRIETADRLFFNPTNIKDAVEFKSKHENTVVVAGGTDVCVYWNKRGIEPKHLMSVSHLPGLRDLQVENGRLVIGARVLLIELEDFVRQFLPEFHRILWLFGSPQIRNAGTLAGNIANGSPIADSLPFLHVMEAELELVSTGGRRTVNINQFYKGYKKLDLRPDELIARIFVPLPARDEQIRLYKVSKRQHLDISAFTAAFKFKLNGGRIERISIAYGGVAPTIVRLRRTEDFITGKQWSLQTMEESGVIAREEIAPISDVRGSADFRLILAENILRKLYFEASETGRQLVCQP